MKLILRNSNIFSEQVEFDPETGVYSKIAKPVAGRAINGCYSDIRGQFLAVYCCRKFLFVRCGEDIFELGENIHFEAEDIQGEERILLTYKERAITGKYKYFVQKGLDIENDPTPGVENEDFDFGVLLANISNNKQRQEILLKQWE